MPKKTDFVEVVRAHTHTHAKLEFISVSGRMAGLQFREFLLAKLPSESNQYSNRKPAADTKVLQHTGGQQQHSKLASNRNGHNNIGDRAHAKFACADSEFRKRGKSRCQAVNRSGRERQEEVQL